MTDYEESWAAAELEQAAFSFAKNTGWNLRFGAEIEWYFITTPSVELLSALFVEMAAQNLPRFVLEKERGVNQYEWALPFVDDAVLLAQQISLARTLIKNQAKIHQNDADFSALPYEDQPGSGLHIHVNLWNEAGEFPLAKNPDSAEESDLMLAVIEGLLRHLQESMPIFAPNLEDKKRYKPRSLSPYTVSWGGNNRTVALRIPCSTANPWARRIEHRVPCANANPFAVLRVIITAIEAGILQNMRPELEKIYGDASDSQYGLPLLY